ncbi:MAG: tol-pal system YbgF family protein [Phycisphaerae bacterium]|jgi:predicted Zn-dependent protease
MDAEHRHELKQNDFEEIMRNLPGFLKKHAKDILCCALIIVAAVLWLAKKEPVRPDIEKQVAVNSAFQDLNTKITELREGTADATELPALYEAVIKKIDSLPTNLQKSFGYIKTADIYRLQARYDRSNLEPISKALELYKKAAEIAAEDGTLCAMAQFGQALSEIDLGNLDAASNLLGQLVTSEKYASTAFPVLAKKRLAVIESLNQSFSFAPAPEPVAEETSAELDAAAPETNS